MDSTRGTDVIEYVACSVYQGYSVPLVELSETEKAILALPHAFTGEVSVVMTEEEREERRDMMHEINELISAHRHTVYCPMQ